MVLKTIIQLLCLLAAPLGSGCVPDTTSPEVSAPLWYDVTGAEGTTVRVAVLRPPDAGGGPHPVIFALPWGGGTEDLVLSFLSSYWADEPAQRGYYVVSAAVRGSSLDDLADELIPAIFELMDAELNYDRGQVALVGASNGGRGIFHAALAYPERFRTLVGLPGQYSGDGADLADLAGKQVRLLVGEQDAGWVASGQATATALEAQGIDTSFEIVVGQGHVLSLNAASLMNGIDLALGR